MKLNQLAGLGAMDTRWNRAKAEACTYVFDGERVAARRGESAEWAIVTCAAGHHARVRFESDGREVWREVSDLARLRLAGQVGER